MTKKQKKNPIESYKVSSSGCWEWTRGTSGNGYGRFWMNGKTIHAPRYFFEYFKHKIPKNRDLDHLCRNRICVNPDHLEIVTRRINIHRGLVTKLNKSVVNTIKKIYREGKMTQVQLAKKYGVDQSNISYIVNDRRWL